MNLRTDLKGQLAPNPHPTSKRKNCPGCRLCASARAVVELAQVCGAERRTSNLSWHQISVFQRANKLADKELCWSDWQMVRDTVHMHDNTLPTRPVACAYGGPAGLP